MYIIKSIRTTTTPEGDGKYNYYDAEATIRIMDGNGENEREAYILVHWEASIYNIFFFKILLIFNSFKFYLFIF